MSWLADKADKLAEENERLRERLAKYEGEVSDDLLPWEDMRAIKTEHENFYSGVRAIVNNPSMPRDHVQSQLLGLLQGTKRWQREG